MERVLPELDDLPYLDGRAWTCGDNVGCGELLVSGGTGETAASEESHASLAIEVGGGRFIVAGVEFGSGDVALPVVRALLSSGIGAVIGRSFVRAFFSAALHLGLPALQVEETGAIKMGDRLRVDIEGHKVVNLSSGDRYVIRNTYGDELDALRAGGLAKLTALKERT